MNNQQSNANRKREQLLNVAVMVAGGWLIWYLSGPYAAEAGRNLYEFVYDKVWGTPYWFSSRFFERAFYYVPNRGHVGNWFYHCAEYAGPIIASPVLYKIPDCIRSAFKWGAGTSNHDQHIDIERGEGDVKPLSTYLNEFGANTLQYIEDDNASTFTPNRHYTHPPSSSKKLIDVAKAGRFSLPMMR